MSEDNNYIYTDVKDDQQWTDLYGSFLVDRIYDIDIFTRSISSSLYNIFAEKTKRVDVEYSTKGIELRYKVEDLPILELMERSLQYRISTHQYTEIAYIQGYQLYYHTSYSKLYNYNFPKNIQIGNRTTKICGKKLLFYLPTDVTFSNYHFTNFCKHNNLSLKEFTSRQDIINHFSTFEPYIIDNKVIHWLSPEQQNDKHRETLKNEYILTYKF